MDKAQQKKNIDAFVKKWTGKGREDEDDRSYWIDMLQSIFDVKNVTDYLQFQKKVKVEGHTKRIDVYIPETNTLIEQKSKEIALDKKGHQSGDIELTPYEQAKRYSDHLGHAEHARWIITSNFQQIWIYDMNEQEPEPVKIELEELPKKYHLLECLISENVKRLNNEMELSVKAGDIVGMLYDAFHAQYLDPDSESSLKSLNELCVRIVFCLYAEDSDEIFGKKNLFHDYMEQFDTASSRKALVDLFRVLDQPEDKRDPYLSTDNPLLACFPYVNGGLFSNENIEIPPFTDEIRDLLLNKASMEFDWSDISPTIFGAVFESTLNQETRRSDGMHYTSVQNIHKVIDPLFLDDLTRELDEIVYENAETAARFRKEEEEKKAESKRKYDEIMKIKDEKLREYELDLWKKEDKKASRTSGVTRRRNISINELTAQLDAFQDKIASLTFLDPACGSGNFLTESYLSLRRLENRVIQEKMAVKGQSGQMQLGDLSTELNPIKVSIQQFYGIEIHDFAATVAKTALWIAESQMLRETERIINTNIDFLPLKSYVNIIEGNALRIDWADVVPKEGLNYIMGNPPFHGFTFMDEKQKDDMKLFFGDVKNLDYVCAWYKKASDFIVDSSIEVAFVSTNSITQGETVARFWPFLTGDIINFAYRTFIWDSEASDKARVHCVIIGFAKSDREKKTIYGTSGCETVSMINPYLMEGESILVTSRNKPLCNIPKMIYGNKPADGGHLIIEDSEYRDFITTNPGAKEMIKPLLGASEYIKGKKRWCLWLVGVSPEKIKKCPLVVERIKKCKESRESSIAAGIRKFAATPTLFAQRTQPTDEDFVIIPRVSSQRREYVPMGFLKAGTIVTDRVQIIPGARIYDFGILTSRIHMAWMRTVCMRLKSDYSYSKDIVYNNFPWPAPTDTQIVAIEKSAQTILDARTKYPSSSLADLYDPVLMPPELRKAHQDNDKAVMAAYGFKMDMSELEIVAELMKMYQELTKEG